MKKSLSITLLIAFLISAMSVFSQSKNGSSQTQNPKTNKGTSGKGNASTTTKPTPSQISNAKATGKTIDKNPTNQTSAQTGVKATPLTYEQVSKTAQPVIQQKTNGDVNWTEQYIEAKGSSVLDNERFKIPAQAKAMATRGAIVIAQRNLLEIINGVNVTSETTVQDMVTKSDYVYTRIDGLVKGARQYGEAIEKDGMIEVTMRVPLYGKDGLSGTVYDELPQIKNKSMQTGDASGQQTGKGQTTGATATAGTQDNGLNGSEGLVFNIKGKQVDPSMFPIVVDEGGNLLLDCTKLYDPNTGKFPKVLQSTEQLFNDLGYQKGADVIDAVQGDNGKIVLDSKNSKKVNWGKVGSTVGGIVKFILALF